MSITTHVEQSGSHSLNVLMQPFSLRTTFAAQSIALAGQPLPTLRGRLLEIEGAVRCGQPCKLDAGGRYPLHLFVSQHTGPPPSVHSVLEDSVLDESDVSEFFATLDIHTCSPSITDACTRSALLMMPW